MELLAPAGNLEKLATAYAYGADAAYIGVRGFSLRAYADTVSEDTSIDRFGDGKPVGRRLYAALNLFAHRTDLDALPVVLERLAALPIDAVIIADLGLLDIVRRWLPTVDLHLSTQANCTNAEAARLYHRLGFSRVIPARELSLAEVADIKQAVPELEIEVFAHGAQCMAYSGRCFLSDHLTGRAANHGDCAQPCRWNYRVLRAEVEEEKRPGEVITLESDRRYLSFLSSRDLNLFDHLKALEQVGVTAIKIEGRMKSAYYVAAVTRAYRAALDALDGDAAAAVRLPEHRRHLEEISHRPYTTGFLLNDSSVHGAATANSPTKYRLMGLLKSRRRIGETSNGWEVSVKNTIHRGQTIEYLPQDGRGATVIEDLDFALFSPDGEAVDRITNASGGILLPGPTVDLGALRPGTVVRALRSRKPGDTRGSDREVADRR